MERQRSGLIPGFVLTRIDGGSHWRTGERARWVLFRRPVPGLMFDGHRLHGYWRDQRREPESMRPSPTNRPTAG